MKGAELVAELGKIAEQTKRRTGVTVAVVITFDTVTDKTAVGAHVPDEETLRLLLERVLRSMQLSKAQIIDRRTR